MDEILQAIKSEAKASLKDIVVDKKISSQQYLTEDQKREILSYLHRILPRILRSKNIAVDAEVLANLAEEIVSEFEGYGVIDKYMRDLEVTDIMVNGPDQIYIERRGIVEKADVSFSNEDEIISLIERMVMESGRRLDMSCPFVDLRIHKGDARVTAVIPPVASASPFFCVRKALRGKLTFDDLLRFGSVNQKMLEFLRYCVQGRLNILISGSTGVGKTTFMNLLIRECVSPKERVIILEDTEELSLRPQEHFIKLLTRPPNIEGKGEVFLHDLVKLALHLRPDRLIIGEVRGDEALQFLQAVNTGHEGSMCTIHANDAEDALVRLETLALMSRVNITQNVVRRFMRFGVDCIIHLSRLPDGRRVVAEVAEFESVDDNFIMKDIFALRHDTSEGNDTYSIELTGYVPSFAQKLIRKAGMPEDFFGQP